VAFSRKTVKFGQKSVKPRGAARRSRLRNIQIQPKTSDSYLSIEQYTQLYPIMEIGGMLCTEREADSGMPPQSNRRHKTALTTTPDQPVEARKRDQRPDPAPTALETKM